METGYMELTVMDPNTGVLDTVYLPTLDGYPLRDEDGDLMLFPTAKGAADWAYIEKESRGLD